MAKVDYPFKDSLCISWYILFAFLLVNICVKWIIYQCLFHLPRKSHLYQEYLLKVNGSMNGPNTFQSIPIEDKTKLLYEYQSIIYSNLCHWVPNGVALIIIKMCIPSTDNQDHNKNTSMNTLGKSETDLIIVQAMDKILAQHTTQDHTEIDVEIELLQYGKMRNFIDYISMETWCNDNAETQDLDNVESTESKLIAQVWRRRHKNNKVNPPNLKLGPKYMNDITKIINKYYIPKYNEENELNSLERRKWKDYQQKQHIPKLLETIYVILKNFMSMISTIIMITEFIEWCNNEVTADKNNYEFKRYLGFVLLFYYHPSMTMTNLMRFTKPYKFNGDKYGNCIMCCPLLLYFFWCMRWMLRDNDNIYHGRYQRDIYFDKYLRNLTLFNFYICVYGIWFISLPLVVTGGFYYVSIIWALYLCAAIGLAIVYGLLRGVVSICGFDLKELVIVIFPWFMTFAFHTTSIAYIVGLIIYGKRDNAVDDDHYGASFRKAFYGTYCSDTWDDLYSPWNGVQDWIVLDWSNWKIVWIVISWLL